MDGDPPELAPGEEHHNTHHHIAHPPITPKTFSSLSELRLSKSESLTDE